MRKFRFLLVIVVLVFFIGCENLTSAPSSTSQPPLTSNLLETSVVTTTTKRIITTPPPTTHLSTSPSMTTQSTSAPTTIMPTTQMSTSMPSHTTHVMTTPVTSIPTTTIPPTTDATTTQSTISHSVTLSYDKVTEADLHVDFTETDFTVTAILTVSGTPLFEGDGEVNDTGIVLYVSFLEAHQVGKHYYLLETTSGIMELWIEIDDTRKPELIGSYTITYETGVDLVLTFELYEGSIFGVSGNGITQSE
ncbi:MAG: hypothetical protein WC351_04370 [Candidatus Izemoplasmatales bacterium]|jgi:hypothetical protein